SWHSRAKAAIRLATPFENKKIAGTPPSIRIRHRRATPSSLGSTVGERGSAPALWVGARCQNGRGARVAGCANGKETADGDPRGELARAARTAVRRGVAGGARAVPLALRLPRVRRCARRPEVGACADRAGRGHA